MAAQVNRLAVQHSQKPFVRILRSHRYHKTSSARLQQKFASAFGNRNRALSEYKHSITPTDDLPPDLRLLREFKEWQALQLVQKKSKRKRKREDRDQALWKDDGKETPVSAFPFD